MVIGCYIYTISILNVEVYYMKSNILYYLRCRELGRLKWMRGKIVVISRPNFNEDFWYYR